ncbi:FosX/FosE/FosI family fosfomycin resistance hydrolase [Desulfoluna spongiiphila]|uniref:Catechol 2,3-dioxygenase n=1 Tax=Desulfoluna spongiiphila TaxID=419481 RepID=A0A1G5H9F5_9BACT|nr:FosX/FosE/FosI family fosfomycin resistance hydrolase [Desulfoluna spongiiphila]SCY59980.1 Catechol 2,3-dioxygenase [Desulfoluna spongiiphila]VVS94513.1 glyoxalase/bleomycin resistance protein/dihydroxybiphenyl dioxygenase [Desulfoluna spongiiphila]
MIESVSHITFVVSDLERMSHFLVAIFDAEEIYDSNGQEFSLSKERFFLINGLWVAIMEGSPISERSYNHVAFKVADADFDLYVKRVRVLGVDILKGRDRVAGEGRSLYFFDHDNHLFEIHTETLNQRLVSYEQMRSDV